MNTRVAAALIGSFVGMSGIESASSFAVPAKFTLNLVDPPPGQPAYHFFLNDGGPSGYVTLPGGPFRLWFEIGIEGWDTAQQGTRLASWELTLDTSTVSNQHIGTIGLAVERCSSDAECAAAFGHGSTCADPPGNPQYCKPAFQNLNRCDWAFDSNPPAGPPYGTFLGTTNVLGPVLDQGERMYGGTIVLDLSADARSFFPEALSGVSGQMLDQFGQSIPSEIPEGRLVRVPTGACCKCPAVGEDACLVLTQFECESLPSRRDTIGSFDCAQISRCFNCATSANCIDGSGACATIRCTECNTCESTLRYDPATECCRAVNGQKFPLTDNNPCTADYCDIGAGEVTHVPMEPGSSCDDGDPCTVDTTCNALGHCRGTQYTGGGCLMNRYLGINVDDVTERNCVAGHAIRVRFLDIAGFPASTGESRWVGPPEDYPLWGSPLPTYKAAPLQCAPHFTDWSVLGVVHVFGDGVLPGSKYLLELVESGCPDLNDIACYFGSFEASTPAWGDVAAPFGTQPNFGDISALVAAFQQAVGAPIKPRAHLTTNVPNPGMAVSFADISAGVRAFQGAGPVFPEPSSCP